MENFCEVYATMDGYAAAEGNINGGLFLRNVKKVFNDYQFITKHNWGDIVLKIRHYTKKEATIVSESTNITQTVCRECTLHCKVKFEKNTSMSNNDDAKDGECRDDDGHFSPAIIQITNLSQKETIVVCVENDPIIEDSKAFHDSILFNQHTDDTTQEMKKRGYVIIKPNTSSSNFYPPNNDGFFLTLLNITTKKQIYDKDRFYENYLYFQGEALHRLIELKPKCSNEEHELKKINVRFSGDSNKYDCDIKGCMEKHVEFFYDCKQCCFCVCQKCCHDLICKRDGITSSDV